MGNNLLGFMKGLFVLRWKPGKDLVIVGVSWILVVASLYTATVIVGADAGGGFPYFLLYAIVTATLFGIGLPVFWMVFKQKRPISDLGITTKNLLLSLILQVIFTIMVLPGGFTDLEVPPFAELFPLFFLTLTIGFLNRSFGEVGCFNVLKRPSDLYRLHYLVQPYMLPFTSAMTCHLMKCYLYFLSD